MLWLTYEQWQNEGFVVIKGEKSIKRNRAGVALFHGDQVVEEFEDVFDFCDSADNR